MCLSIPGRKRLWGAFRHRLWLYRGHPNFAAFTSGGFGDSGNTVVWGGRLFGEEDAATGEFFNRWHLSMLDSDIF